MHSRVPRFCRSLRALLIALLALLASPAFAIEVAPITVEMIGGARAAVVTVVNNNPAPVTIQARLFDWTQPGGEDAYAPAFDVQASPPIVTVAGGASQVVRIVATGPVGVGERSLRLLIDELPAPGSGGAGVQIPIRLSLPVFLTPDSRMTPALSWRAQRAGSELVITALNSGPRRARLADLRIMGSDGIVLGHLPGLAGYVLSGAERSWRVSAPGAGGVVHITATDDLGPVHATASIF